MHICFYLTFIHTLKHNRKREGRQLTANIVEAPARPAEDVGDAGGGRRDVGEIAGCRREEIVLRWVVMVGHGLLGTQQ